MSTKLSDVQKEQSLLGKIKSRARAAIVSGKIVTLSREQTRFVCPNHKIKTVIDMHENGLRKQENQMEEFVCDCGTIYQKKG